MILEKIEIENFGPFTNKTSVKLIGNFVSLIGENGTGKSSIIFLINLLLNKRRRKKGVSPEWIPDPEKEVKIKFIFNTETLRKIQVFLPIEENKKITIDVLLKLKEDNVYYPIINIGEIENLEYSHLQKLPFDDFVQIINIKPYYENYNESWINKKLDKYKIIKNIEKEIKNTNEKISKILDIQMFSEYVNEQIRQIFKDEEFNVKLISNIKTTKIGKALNFFPVKSGKIIETHGEGFDKIFSIIAKINFFNDTEKIKIVTIDELENHLFYIYQSKIVDYLFNLTKKNQNVTQVITTTHSPNIVKINPNSSIIKLRKNEESSFYHFRLSEKTHFDFYQKELATAVFYENILLVEGHSEKLFYEYIIKNNSDVKNFINTSDIFVMNIQGTNFINSIKFLKKLAKNLFILTDNDVWKDNSGEEICQGLKRINEIKNECFDCKNNKYDFSKNNIQNNEHIAKEIINSAKSSHIYTQNKIGSTFEDALHYENLITSDQKNNLESAKLKNLSKIINKIADKITIENIEQSTYIFEWMWDFKKNYGK